MKTLLLASPALLLLSSSLACAQTTPASAPIPTPISSRGGVLLALDLNTPALPQAATSVLSGATAKVKREDVGTIDTYQGQPSGALSLTADFSRAKTGARVRLASGALPLRNTEANLAKLTLGFDAFLGAVRPIGVIVQSLDGAGQSTGARFATVTPPVAATWTRTTLDLDKTQPLSGVFNPRAPRIQLMWELGDSDGKVTRAANQTLRIDNISLSVPSIYVSAGGNDAADGRAEKTAFATLQKALDVAAAGDVISVMNGQYTSDNREQIALMIKSGTPTRWITLRAYPGHQPELHTTGWNGVRINAAASYLEVRDLIVRGRRRELKLEDALADGVLKTKNGRNHPGDPTYNSNGISIQSTTPSQTERPHHIRILGNTVVDNPGGGISAIGCDWVTIEGNITRDNCHFMRYGGSGISVFRSWDFDNFTGHKMLVVGNVASGNRTFVPWAAIGKISDGNGIIVDDNINSQTGASKVPYEGRTLVQNNLSFGNGGSGIHAYASRFVDIVNNTAYLNAQSPELMWSQIFAGGKCDDVRILNNVFYAPKGKPLDLSVPKNSTRIVYANNLFWGEGENAVKSGGGLGAESGTATGDAGTNLQADPKFLAPSLDPALADFRLAPGSPALGAARVEAVTPLFDLKGKVRGAKPDLGAYQVGK